VKGFGALPLLGREILPSLVLARGPHWLNGRRATIWVTTFAKSVGLSQRSRWSHKIERMPMLRKLYRLDEAARRMRVRVLSVIFGAAFAIIIAKIVLNFVGH
jgi:hypothetical protein